MSNALPKWKQWLLGMWLLWLADPAVAQPQADTLPRDPAAWGTDHIGQALPEYMTGDECLFCHRQIGASWSENPHQRSLRTPAADEPAMKALHRFEDVPDVAADVQFLLGSQRLTRYLKRSTGYGKLDLLTMTFDPTQQQVQHSGDGESADWDDATFADRCAGCHATAVDANQSFAALSLDCYVCHGDVKLEHSSDVRQVWLSRQSMEPRQIISICGQCHLRGGRSATTGRPYPHLFVPGDNLFRDFRVDWSEASIARLPAEDKHIFLNARDVVGFDQTMTDCLTCHEVHAGTSQKHQSLAKTAVCNACHLPGTDSSELVSDWSIKRQPSKHSRTCEY